MLTREERGLKRAARAEEKARHAACVAAIKAVVIAGACPKCGRPLRRNLALAGWWQCEQLGAEGWRKDPTCPSCDWQGFTE